MYKKACDELNLYFNLIVISAAPHLKSMTLLKSQFLQALCKIAATHVNN